MKKHGISELNNGRLLLVTTALLWGLAGVCVKSIPWNSLSIMAARCFIASIMLAFSRKSLKIHFTKMTVWGAVFQSLTGILYLMSIKLTTAATAIVLQYIAPILIFLYTVIFQKIKPKLSETLIVFMVFGGCVLSFADGLDPTHVVGNILGLASGFTFAAQIIILNDSRADSEAGVFMGNVMSFFICLPFMFFDKGLDFSGKTIFWVLVLGIFQYGCANICYSKGCQKVPKLESSLILTLEPIFNPIPVWLVTGEKMGPFAMGGFVIVIAGIILFSLLPMIEAKKKNRSVIS